MDNQSESEKKVDYLHDDQSQAVESESKDKEIFPDGMKVLAVDDDIVCLRWLQTVLLRCRYKVTVALEGTTALKLLREEKNKFDIVLTDVHMPDIDGFRLLEIISLEMDIPVIMISANDDKNMVMKGIEHGARDYLIKPIRKEEIQNIWQHVIRKKLFHSNESIVKKEITVQNSKSTKRQRGTNKEKESALKNDPGEDILTHKKQRVIWIPQLHKKFVNAVHQIGIDKAVPKKILEHINEPGISRENVASHLQKFRRALKKNSDTANQKSSINVDSNGTNGHPSITTITSSNHQDSKRMIQPNGFEVKGYNNLGSIQHGQSVQNSCIFGTSAANPKPYSLPALNQRGALLQHYPQVPEIADQMRQRSDLTGLGGFSSNPLRMYTLHHHPDFNGLKYQCSPRINYMEISSHPPLYNASSGIGSGDIALNGSASTLYPNICFGGSSGSCAMPTDASSGLSTIVQHDSISEAVQNFLPAGQSIGISPDIQNSSLQQHVMKSDNLISVYHHSYHFETESSIDDEDLHAAISQSLLANSLDGTTVQPSPMPPPSESSAKGLFGKKDSDGSRIEEGDGILQFKK